MRTHLPVDNVQGVNSPNDNLTRKFRTLQSLIKKEGRLVLIEDLIGISGALFRIYWPADERPRPDGAPGAASVCSGDPLMRGAAAYQYRLTGRSNEKDNSLSIQQLSDIATLEDRIDFFLDSLREALRLSREGEYFDGERYLSGRTAYQGIIRAVEREETGKGREGRCREELGEVLPAIGGSRIMLGRYLDRLGNFMGTGPAIDSFEKEGAHLLEAGRLLEEEAGWSHSNRRTILKLLNNAQRNYSRGHDVINSVLEEGASR